MFSEQFAERSCWEHSRSHIFSDKTFYEKKLWNSWLWIYWNRWAPCMLLVFNVICLRSIFSIKFLQKLYWYIKIKTRFGQPWRNNLNICRHSSRSDYCYWLHNFWQIWISWRPCGVGLGDYRRWHNMIVSNFDDDDTDNVDVQDTVHTWQIRRDSWSKSSNQHNWSR